MVSQKQKRKVHKKTRNTKRKQSRKNRKTRKMYYRKQKGGASLPVPRGSVAAVRLDPKDEYSVPVLVDERVFEEEVLEE